MGESGVYDWRLRRSRWLTDLSRQNRCEDQYRSDENERTHEPKAENLPPQMAAVSAPRFVIPNPLLRVRNLFAYFLK